MSKEKPKTLICFNRNVIFQYSLPQSNIDFGEAIDPGDHTAWFVSRRVLRSFSVSSLVEALGERLPIILTIIYTPNSTLWFRILNQFLISFDSVAIDMPERIGKCVRLLKGIRIFSSFAISRPRHEFLLPAVLTHLAIHHEKSNENYFFLLIFALATLSIPTKIPKNIKEKHFNDSCPMVELTGERNIFAWIAKNAFREMKLHTIRRLQLRLTLHEREFLLKLHLLPPDFSLFLSNAGDCTALSELIHFQNCTIIGTFIQLVLMSCAFPA